MQSVSLNAFLVLELRELCSACCSLCTFVLLYTFLEFCCGPWPFVVSIARLIADDRSYALAMRSSTLLQCSSTFFYALAMDAFFYALAMDAFLVLEMRVQGALHTFSSFVAVRFVSLIRSRDARGLSGRPGAAAGEGVSLPVLPRFAAFSRGFAVFHCACCRSTSSRCLPPPSNPTACCRQILPCMMLNGSPLHRPSLTAAFPLARFCRG